MLQTKATTKQFPFYGTHDPLREFLAAIANAGIGCTEPDRIAANGHIARFHVEGDKRNTRNGWAILFIGGNGAGGAFGHWSTGTTLRWSSRGTGMSVAERRRFEAEIRAAKAHRAIEQQQEHESTGVRAQRAWDEAGTASPAHPYLTRKGVKAHGIRQRGALLVVPLRDATGKLWSLEYIDADGAKRFLSGGRKRGCFHVLGFITDEVLIAEGYATAASLYEATGIATVVAFDCGNLAQVAEAIREKYPAAKIVLCADNDGGTPGNPGLTKAQAAAMAVGGVVAIPPEGFNDFNDAARVEMSP